MGANIVYTLNGTDFRDYGVYVSKSDGLFDRPAIKLDDGNMDLSKAYVSARDITLSCFIKAASKEQFIGRMCGFTGLLNVNALSCLVIHAGTIVLPYMVYCSDAIEVEKEWSNHLMVGTFKLKLKEPEPVKKVIEANASCTITMTTPKAVNIYWGDGNCSLDVVGDISVRHDYDSAVRHYVVVTGDIDCIKGFVTNGTIIFSKI